MTAFEMRHFDDFLHQARQQPEAHRLLLVFTRPELPAGHTDRQARRFAEGEGGHLAPVVCVDKRPHAIERFERLVEEATETGQSWSVLFVGALFGPGGDAPDDEQTEQALTRMVDAIRGGRVSDYLVFDRDGHPLTLSADG